MTEFSDSLCNTYFAARHGESEANARGIIVSDPKIGTSGFGLTATGTQQVLESAGLLANLGRNFLIVSSDFVRTQETAELLHSVVDSSTPVVLNHLLRERFFGKWDGQSDTNYSRVWEQDKHDSDHEVGGVESVTSVVSRITRLISQLEHDYAATNVLVVSHGDVLQIMQCVFEDVAVTQHRELPSLHTAEIRRFN